MREGGSTDELIREPERLSRMVWRLKIFRRHPVTAGVRHYGLLHQVWSIVYDIGRTGRTRSVASGDDRHQKNPRVTCDLTQLSCE